MVVVRFVCLFLAGRERWRRAAEGRGSCFLMLGAVHVRGLYSSIRNPPAFSAARSHWEKHRDAWRNSRQVA